MEILNFQCRYRKREIRRVGDREGERGRNYMMEGVGRRRDRHSKGKRATDTLVKKENDKTDTDKK